MLIVVAPSSMAICEHLGGELDVGAGGVHRRELDVVAQRARPARPTARAWPLTSSRVDCSWCSMWMSDVERKVWMRGRSRVAHRLPGAVDVAGVGAGEAGDDGALDLAGDRLDGLEVARRGDREAGLDDVDAQPRELVGDLELLGRVERDARRLLAVAQRRVEDQDSVRVGMSVLSLSASSCGFFSGWVCGFAAATRYSPRRGRRRSRRSSRNDMARG